MFNFIDTLLDKVTMYRLVLYVLIGFLLTAVGLSFFHILPYNPFALIFSIGFLLAVCLITNAIFSHVFEVPTNIDSAYITAFILACILTPIRNFDDAVFFGWVALWSMASKYMFAIRKKHIFNPVAIAVFIVSLGLGQSATWWIGTTWMMPVVVIGGLLIVKKIQREDLVTSFFVTAIISTLGLVLLKGGSIFTTAQHLVFASSLFFFAFIMLTEPLTTPPTKKLQIIYGGVVGILFSPQFHIGSLSLTPEQALLIGNIFSYLVSPKEKLILHLKEKLVVGKDIMDFLFVPQKKFNFIPGQYMEWTLPSINQDSRGNRRYFTIASSPTEETLRLGVRFYHNGSSYKKQLQSLDSTTPIVAGQRGGDFVLPADISKKLVFVAGGIGITPFRSMLKYLIDTQQKRDIVVVYSNKTADEIVYTDVLEKAAATFGMKIIYTLTATDQLPENWQGERGRITPEMIQRDIPDFSQRYFYLSGPHAMVQYYQTILQQLHIPKKQIIVDFFPGFA